MRHFVAKVIEQQELRHMNGKEFAAYLGVSPAEWSRIRNSRREPTMKFVRAVLRRWPELVHYLAQESAA